MAGKRRYEPTDLQFSLSEHPAVREVGSCQAKTHHPALLKAFEKGETIVITRRGTPVARLVPAGQDARTHTRAVIARMRRARARRHRVTLDEILSAKDEGRKS